MRILSVTAQKADSTGSGVFLTELVRGFQKMGWEQAVICGTVEGETIALPEDVRVFPVFYESRELPFPVCGMSDEMPYRSTRYRDLTEQMTHQLTAAFHMRIMEAVETFRPDVILCHHLYFAASLVRELCPDIPVYGQCHGSDLRQLAGNPWQRDWILSQIRKLDGIFALHAAQKQTICDLFDVPAEQVSVVGTGYNSNVFHRDALLHESREDGKLRLIFAGKLSEKKGVFSLLRSLHYLRNPKSVELWLAGGCGNPEEYESICRLAQVAPSRVRLLGKLTQQELAKCMNQCDVFVLPSFFEGLPLVLMEAMACGLRVVCTDLPGIQLWLDAEIPQNGAVFVRPPRIRNADEPLKEDLPDFEKRLAAAMEAAVSHNLPDSEAIRAMSWDALCERLCVLFRKGNR